MTKGHVHPRTGHKGPEGVEVQLYTFFNLGARCKWMVSAMPQPLYLQKMDLVPITQKAGWAPRPVWRGVKNLAPTGIHSPNNPAGTTDYTILGPPEMVCHQLLDTFLTQLINSKQMD